jgi:hypothetical protein
MVRMEFAAPPLRFVAEKYRMRKNHRFEYKTQCLFASGKNYHLHTTYYYLLITNY